MSEKMDSSIVLTMKAGLINLERIATSLVSILFLIAIFKFLIRVAAL